MRRIVSVVSPSAFVAGYTSGAADGPLAIGKASESHGGQPRPARDPSYGDRLWPQVSFRPPANPSRDPRLA